jgi:hypothetical protein
MVLAALIGIMAIYSIYLLITTGEQKHFYFLLGYIAIIIFMLRDKIIKKS